MLALSKCAAAAFVFAALLHHKPAHAQAYPTKPINIIVGLAAGTGMDVIVRLYADKLSQTLGQPVVVENRPGAAGLATMEAILKAPADGYTLAVATSSAMAIRPTMFKKLPYDSLNDFVPIALYLKSPFILVVNPALPIRSVPDLIAYIKERPGQISYSSPSVGGAPHLAGEYLKQRFGIEMTHVPYRNSPQAIQDVAAGHVPLTFAEAGASLPLIRDGKLRALAVTSTTRLAALPDVPPFAEASGLSDFETVSWHLLFVRSATPKDVVNKLHDGVKRIMARPDMRNAIANLGLIPHGPAPIEETHRYLASEVEKWATIVKSLGLAGTH
jgi:tripartite-type tricarboxylate transporter receptor subunit TctC